MVKFEGKYELEKNENFVEYLKSTGQEITDEIAKKIRESKSVLTVEVVGEQQYKFLNKNVFRDHLFSFTIGKPFQEIIETQGITSKYQNVAAQEGNKITISSLMNGKKTERIYDFSESGLILTFQSPESKIVGKEYFKRV